MKRYDVFLCGNVFDFFLWRQKNKFLGGIGLVLTQYKTENHNFKNGVGHFLTQ